MWSSIYGKKYHSIRSSLFPYTVHSLILSVSGFAFQMDLMGDAVGHKVLPIVIHGDAAFAGQGIVYETMQMAQLDAYQTGGSINVICNNQIGFTATPQQGRSTR